MVPFKDKQGRYQAQLIIGYRGLIDLARRSGQIETIEARCVFEGDEWEQEFGLEPKLRHRPNWDAERTENTLLRVYGIARLRNGETVVEVMPKREIDRIRARSKAAKDGPWVTDYLQMARKTVIIRMSKYLPLSVEVAAALRMEDQAEEGGPQNIDVLAQAVAEPPPATKADEVVQAITSTPSQEEVEEAASVSAKDYAWEEWRETSKAITPDQQAEIASRLGISQVDRRCSVETIVAATRMAQEMGAATEDVDRAAFDVADTE
jgi:recombination protein RecT